MHASNLTRELFGYPPLVHHPHSHHQADQALLGKSGGEAVRLVVHHTHNSEAKQWDETVVLALSGTARLLKAHLSEILTLKEGQAGEKQEFRGGGDCLAISIFMHLPTFHTPSPLPLRRLGRDDGDD